MALNEAMVDPAILVCGFMVGILLGTVIADMLRDRW